LSKENWKFYFILFRKFKQEKFFSLKISLLNLFDYIFSQEDYVPPKEEKKFNAFAGQGVSLDSSNSIGLEINKNVTFQVDANLPKTIISFRLHNGESVQQEFNLTHTVHDVKKFVAKVAPVQGEFNLVEGFPPKPLLDMGKTIQEAKLQNCMITQRLL